MTDPEHTPDRAVVERRLAHPRARVWRAIADAREFGAWFECVFDEPFTAGAHMSGRITTAGYEHLPMDLIVVAIEPEERFAFRWRPYAIDPTQDYSAEPRTLVEFLLRDDGDGGTVLTITESGFAGVPAARRATAFTMNARGWEIQADRIGVHVGRQS